jgi:hypothetical protein
MVNSARSSRAVEAHGVNTNGTARLSSSGSGRLGWVDNSNVLCTTALGVGDGASTGAARGLLLAGSSTRHAVVEFKLTVELNGDLELGD